MPEVSLCMIVKNEELFLPQCLESVKDIVNEIILVDTGSTDKTIEVAKATLEIRHDISLKIYNFPWIEDFSAARNESLKYATRDWILTLDADHILDKKSVPLIKQLINVDDALAYLVKIFMYTGDTDNIENTSHQAESILFKLFRNNMGINYKGVVHEQNWQSILKAKQSNPGFNTYDSNIIVHHRGYTLKGYELHNPVERNTQLIEKALSEEKLSLEENLYYKINHAELLKIQGKAAEAKNIFLEVMEVLKKQDKRYLFAVPVTSVLYTNLTELFIEEDKMEEAKNILDLAIEFFPNVPTYYYYLGQYYLRHNNFRTAYQMFNKCTRFGENMDYDKEVSFNKGIITYLAYFGLGMCLFNMGAAGSARKAFEKSLEFNPDFPLAKDILSKF